MKLKTKWFEIKFCKSRQNTYSNNLGYISFNLFNSSLRKSSYVHKLKKCAMKR